MISFPFNAHASGQGSMTDVLNFVVQQIEAFGGESFLDAGCGPGTYLHPIRAARPDLVAYAVDAHEPSLAKVAASQKWCGGMPWVLAKVPSQSVDVVICLDVIEHLRKGDSLITITQLERIARKGVILFTPSGFMPQPPLPDNPWMEHICGWEAHELDLLGYETAIWQDFDYGNGKRQDALWAVKTLSSQS